MNKLQKNVIHVDISNELPHDIYDLLASLDVFGYEFLYIYPGVEDIVNFGNTIIIEECNGEKMFYIDSEAHDDSIGIDEVKSKLIV